MRNYVKERENVLLSSQRITYGATLCRHALTRVVFLCIESMSLGRLNPKAKACPAPDHCHNAKSPASVSIFGFRSIQDIRARV